MGNCQAIDNATLVIQQPSGRVFEKLYWSVPASDIMKMNPGHYVALLLTTTSYPSTTTNNNKEPLRITRIKLLRPTDTLVLGHTYRLISAREAMKGLWAKKYAKMQKKQSQASGRLEENASLDFDTDATRTYELEKKTNQQVIKHDRHRPWTSASSTNSATAKSRGWHPSLNSISETGS